MTESTLRAERTKVEQASTNVEQSSISIEFCVKNERNRRNIRQKISCQVRCDSTLNRPRFLDHTQTFREFDDVPNRSTAIHRGAERRKFAQSSLRDKAYMLAMMGSQALCQSVLPVVHTKKLSKGADRLAKIYRRSPLPRPRAEKIIERAEIVKNLQLWRAECVAESLVLWTCLRAGDHPAVLRVGCRNIFGHVEAHMWVELDGKPLLDIDNEYETWQAFDEDFAAAAVNANATR